jgi:hypothetical protein
MYVLHVGHKFAMHVSSVGSLFLVLRAEQTSNFDVQIDFTMYHVMQ